MKDHPPLYLELTEFCGIPLTLALLAIALHTPDHQCPNKVIFSSHTAICDEKDGFEVYTESGVEYFMGTFIQVYGDDVYWETHSGPMETLFKTTDGETVLESEFYDDHPPY